MSVMTCSCGTRVNTPTTSGKFKCPKCRAPLDVPDLAPEPEPVITSTEEKRTAVMAVHCRALAYANLVLAVCFGVLMTGVYGNPAWLAFSFFFGLNAMVFFLAKAEQLEVAVEALTGCRSTGPERETTV